MASEYRSLPAARSANQLFAAMFTGAYALLFVDRYAAGQLASDWTVLVLGALVLVLGVLGFPAVERRGSRWLTAAYFAIQSSLGVAIFAGSVLGGTFPLLVIVGQSVRVLPPWGTLWNAPGGQQEVKQLISGAGAAFAYDAVIADVARHMGGAVARSVSRNFVYPVDVEIVRDLDAQPDPATSADRPVWSWAVRAADSSPRGWSCRVGWPGLMGV